ncbi:DUF998 domain-containing protein [Gordonia hongkongensis]|uniref:DUF998 domain-containing protein n=1 Tax=Gordonia hongkongensis TaxID=1701090 RepID=A0AAX3T6T6_9ACTN|nr:DUF998 domain-containing protein [Gordonia hongkongensis]WFP24702.1 DUF998 domain-containing protein [Gordonia hongkongensis]
MRRSLAGILIAVAGLCYSSWVLEFAWADSLDPMRTFLSELDVANRPHRDIYVVGDVTTGVCALVAALLLLVPRPPFPRWLSRHRAERGAESKPPGDLDRLGQREGDATSVFRDRTATTAVIALAVFGAATIANAQLPIECIPGVDPGCPGEPSGLLPQLHHIHALTSTVAVFAIFTVMVAAGVSAVRTTPDGPVWPVLRWVGNAVLVIVALATVWMLLADNLVGDYRLGLAQRIQVGGMSVWMVLWGWAVVGSRGVDRTPEAEHVVVAPGGFTGTEWGAVNGTRDQQQR